MIFIVNRKMQGFFSVDIQTFRHVSAKDNSRRCDFSPVLPSAGRDRIAAAGGMGGRLFNPRLDFFTGAQELNEDGARRSNAMIKYFLQPDFPACHSGGWIS